MKIIDLEERYLRSYFMCLEEWSDEMKEAGNHKEKWYENIKGKGLRVKLALNDEEKPVGMIQYIPIEYSFTEGKDLYFVNCIWVHGYKKHGVGNFQGKGVGKALLQAAEDEVKSLGAKGLVVWGISLPFFMKASWFKKHGYTKVDNIGMQVLLWKPFNETAMPPFWIKEKKKPEMVDGKVIVNSFINGWCPAQSLTCERAKRAATELGDKVEYKEINTFDRSAFSEWGISDALFINGKKVRTGPPPSYAKIKKKIWKKVKKIN
jgi:GNAT superfamily N-acetyltransferase